MRRSETARRLANRLPDSAREALRAQVIRSPRARWGNLRRMKPFSPNWGFSRGTPVDRILIDRFIEGRAPDIRGAVLEVMDPRYTTRFGGDAVTRSEVLDIDPSNRRATIIADLCEPRSLPPDEFDCFVMTQTLELLAEPEAALENAVSTLRPGGVLLLSVPTITKSAATDSYRDFWRWTPEGLERLLRRTCPGSDVEVVGCGNLVVAIAFLLALAAEDLRDRELRHYDPTHAILACARVRKPDSRS